MVFLEGWVDVDRLIWGWDGEGSRFRSILPAWPGSQGCRPSHAVGMMLRSASVSS
jgi:hypothetical protein